MTENTYSLREVFTPSTPARVAFVERERINKKLVNALQTPGKQIVVYGHSGSGKTTLLVNKLHQLYEYHITTRCMRATTFNQLLLDAFDQLSPYYVSECSNGRKTTRTAELAGTYLAIQSKINASTTDETAEKQVRFLPPQLTAQNLGRLIGAAKCCWVLEDFHKISSEEKPSLAQLMKVFMDMSDEYPELKIVALGAVDTARQVVDYDPEMRNRVAEIQVDLMDSPEINEIIAKGEQALQIEFSPEVKKSIANYSNGLGAVCHHLCLNMCDAAGIIETSAIPVKISDSHLEEALKNYLEEASDSIRSAFDRALKEPRKNRFNNAEIVLRTLCYFPERGASRADLMRKIKETWATFPVSNLKYFLEKLSTEEFGALLRFVPISGLYSFSDPIYRVFAMTLYKDQFEKKKSKVDQDDDVTRIVRMLVEQMSKSETRFFRVTATDVKGKKG